LANAGIELYRRRAPAPRRRLGDRVVDTPCQSPARKPWGHV